MLRSLLGDVGIEEDRGRARIEQGPSRGTLTAVGTVRTGFQGIERVTARKGHCSQIELQEGAGPASVNSYRYPHHHKEAIEKPVQNMFGSRDHWSAL